MTAATGPGSESAAPQKDAETSAGAVTTPPGQTSAGTVTTPPGQAAVLAARRHVSEDMAATLLERMADRIGARATATAVFGEPVVHGRVTVVPVARIAFGFGGGAGGGAQDGDYGGGGGGGGGADARPLGFIEITDTGAVFKPVRDPWTDIVLPLAALALVAAPSAARAWPKLAKVFRARH